MQHLIGTLIMGRKLMLNRACSIDIGDVNIRDLLCTKIDIFLSLKAIEIFIAPGTWSPTCRGSERTKVTNRQQSGMASIVREPQPSCTNVMFRYLIFRYTVFLLSWLRKEWARR